MLSFDANYYRKKNNIHIRYLETRKCVCNESSQQVYVVYYAMNGDAFVAHFICIRLQHLFTSSSTTICILSKTMNFTCRKLYNVPWVDFMLLINFHWTFFVTWFTTNSQRYHFEIYFVVLFLFPIRTSERYIKSKTTVIKRTGCSNIRR